MELIFIVTLWCLNIPMSNNGKLLCTAIALLSFFYGIISNIRCKIKNNKLNKLLIKSITETNEQIIVDKQQNI
jgi:hypothetical protein